MAEDRILPIVQGDWVAPTWDGPVMIGRVKQSYWCGDDVLMDVVLYDFKGVVIGRNSPAEGGPKTFEPAITFNEEWTRVHKPEFPLKLEMVGKPSATPGMVSLVLTLHHEGRQALKKKAVRVKARKQSRDYARADRVVFVPAEPSNQVDIEISSLRRSAQELRSAARMLPSHQADLLVSKARGLEADAQRLMEKS